MCKGMAPSALGYLLLACERSYACPFVSPLGAHGCSFEALGFCCLLCFCFFFWLLWCPPGPEFLVLLLGSLGRPWLFGFSPLALLFLSLPVLLLLALRCARVGMALFRFELQGL